MVRGPPPVEWTDRKNFLHKEPGVITDALIAQCLDELLPRGEAGEYARKVKHDPRRVDHIKIEYHSLAQITSIKHMVTLTKLQLCNNVIGKIENLEELTNLVWLDLSFNCIRKIENLDKLTKLQVLNLHRNLIVHIENMDNLLKLEMFHISSNGLQIIEEVKYLRRFVCLRSVTFRGNVVSRARADFRLYLLAHVPQITIVDYDLILPKEKAQAVERYKNQIDKMDIADTKLLRRYSIVAAEAEVAKRREEAFVVGFEGDDFWKSLFENDPEGKAIIQLNDADDVQVMYRELFRRASRDLFEKGMRSYSTRQAEFTAWGIAVNEEKIPVQKRSIALTEDFVEYSRPALKDIKTYVSIIEDYIRRLKDGPKPKEFKQLRRGVSRLAREYVRKLHTVWYEIMTDEMTLNEKMTETNLELEHSITDIVSVWLEQLRGYFGAIRELQVQLNERLVEVLVTYGDFRLSNTNIPEGLEHIIVDKEALSNALQLSNEHHNAVIDSKEDIMVTSLRKWLDDTQGEISRGELWRNRHRISEVGHFTDVYHKYLIDSRVLSHVTSFIPDVRADQNRVPKRDGPKFKVLKDEPLFDYVKRRSKMRKQRGTKKKRKIRFLPEV